MPEPHTNVLRPLAFSTKSSVCQADHASAIVDNHIAQRGHLIDGRGWPEEEAKQMTRTVRDWVVLGVRLDDGPWLFRIHCRAQKRAPLNQPSVTTRSEFQVR